MPLALASPVLRPRSIADLIPIRRHELPATLAVVGIGLVTLVGVARGAIGYDGASLNLGLGGLVLLWLTGIWAEARGLPRLGQAIRVIAIFLLLAIATALASAVVATWHLPLADALLVNADQLLLPGLDWPAAMRTLERHAWLMEVLSRAYVTLSWQPAAIMVLFCAIGRERSAWRLLTAWAAALIVSLIIFPFVPALSGYVYFGIDRVTMANVHCDTAWQAPLLLQQLRDGRVDQLRATTLDGLISMPSFHAAAAVMLGWGWGQLRVLRWPGWLLNGTMFVSAVPIGGHYVVDILAGGIVALAAIRFSRPSAISGDPPADSPHDRQIEKLVPQPHPEAALGLVTRNAAPPIFST